MSLVICNGVVGGGWLVLGGVKKRGRASMPVPDIEQWSISDSPSKAMTVGSYGQVSENCQIWVSLFSITQSMATQYCLRPMLGSIRDFDNQEARRTEGQVRRNGSATSRDAAGEERTSLREQRNGGHPRTPLRWELPRGRDVVPGNSATMLRLCATHRNVRRMRLV